MAVKVKERRSYHWAHTSRRERESFDNAISAEPVSIFTLHRRLVGHISVDAIRNLLRTRAITGVHVIDEFPPFVCDSCEYAKTTRKTIQKERQAQQAPTFGDEVHTDVWDPSPTLSLGGRRYYVSFTDDCTRYTRLEVLYVGPRMKPFGPR